MCKRNNDRLIFDTYHIFIFGRRIAPGIGAGFRFHSFVYIFIFFRRLIYRIDKQIVSNYIKFWL